MQEEKEKLVLKVKEVDQRKVVEVEEDQQRIPSISVKMMMVVKILDLLDNAVLPLRGNMQNQKW